MSLPIENDPIEWFFGECQRNHERIPWATTVGRNAADDTYTIVVFSLSSPTKEHRMAKFNNSTVERLTTLVRALKLLGFKLNLDKPGGNWMFMNLHGDMDEHFIASDLNSSLDLLLLGAGNAS